MSASTDLNTPRAPRQWSTITAAWVGVRRERRGASWSLNLKAVNRPEHWWRDRPSWLDAQYETESELRWLSEAESRRRLHDLASAPTDPRAGGWAMLLREGAAAPTTAVAVAELPERTDRTGQTPYHPTLWVDAARPQRWWLALDAMAPPPAWIDAGATLDALRAAYAPYAPEGLRPEASLHREHSFFVCFAEEAPLDQLAQMVASRPLMDGALMWGSARAHDPWRASVRMPAIELRHAVADDLVQHGGKQASFSWRSAFSQSLVRLREHRLRVTVCDVRYRPATSRATVAALNGLRGVDLPLDLPVDVAAGLLALPQESSATLEARLRDAPPPDLEAEEAGLPSPLVDDALAFAVLHAHDLPRARWVVREALGRSPYERQAARLIAKHLGLYADLAELVAREPDPSRLGRESWLLDLGDPS